MDIEELIEYLKEGLYIYDPETGTSIDDDPEWIALPDKHLERAINVAISNVDPSKNLNDITQDDVYPVILQARKEIYYVLATKSAPLYDLSIAGTAGSSSISRDQRFKHYMELIAEVNKEYRLYLNTGVKLQAVDCVLDSNYFSNRNYTLAKKPRVNLKIDNVYPNEIEISWGSIKVDKFADFKVYVNEDRPVIDRYSKEIIRSNAKLVDTIQDFHRRHCRVEKLVPETRYYLAVVITERNGLRGYSEHDIMTTV